MSQPNALQLAREKFEREKFVGQEGSRWINQRPTGAEIAKWFKDNVRLHDGMEADPYVPGIVIIPASEKVEVPMIVDEQGKNGQTYSKVQRVAVGVNEIFVPYAKVETRVAYFWDWCEHNGYLGELEPMPVKAPAETLPVGFSTYGPSGSDGKTVWFVACSYRVSVWKVGDDGERRLVMAPAAGTKIVPVAGRYSVDENAVMKAETGAIGRALGMAGMLALPGSGIATAEDMVEAMNAGGAAPTAGVEAAVPEVLGAAEAPGALAAGGDQPVGQLAQAIAILEELKANHPEAHAAVQAWAKERKINLGSLAEDSSQLRAVIRKLERALEEATGGVPAE